MDYKKIYLQRYYATLDDQEKKVKDILDKFKVKDRTYPYSRDEVSGILFRSEKEFESLYPFESIPEFHELFQNNKDYYAKDNLKLILENEFKELFKEVKPFEIRDYHSFLSLYAQWNGLKDAYYNFGAQTWLNELYYENNEIEKISLTALQGDIKEHEDYIRLIKKKLPDIEELKTPKKASQKENKVESQSITPNLDNDEKLLLIHYLLHSDSLEKFEKVKILALLGTTPIDSSIFQQESRMNKHYNQVIKGYEYFGKKSGKDKLTSLYEQVESFKISNLNRAIKMDLNKVKKEEIENNLKKV